MLNEIKKIKSGVKELREFGLTIGSILVILGSLALWRGRAVYPWFFTAGTLLVGFGVFLPKALKPLQRAWMAFSLIIGFFMSHLIMVILFCIIIIPMGLIIKIIGKDILALRISKDRPSYWIDRSVISKTKDSYENQY